MRKDHPPEDATGFMLSLPVTGMTCASCVRHVERALTRAPGARDASVNLATGIATIQLDTPEQAKALPALLEAAGYPVREETAAWRIEGMTCASCVNRVEEKIAALPGVLAASVNLATGQARIRAVFGLLPDAAVMAAVEAAGYQARRLDPRAAAESADDTEERHVLWRDLIIAAILTAPVFAIEMGGHLFPALHHAVGATLGHAGSAYLQFGLTTLVMLWPGRRFYRVGLASLLRGAPEMNALVALGTLAAWGFSVVATFQPGLLPQGTAHLYFEAAAVIIVLILLGRYLEAISKGRTGAAIRHLVGLRPRIAEVLRDGQPQTVPIGEVKVGDHVRIRPGERVPVDGEIVEGTSHIDEAMITGEPVPVLRGPGGPVIGGTVNGNGSFTFRATRVGADTVLAEIVRLVETAQGSKLPIQKLVDRVTGVFVPAVLGLALATFGVWLVFAPPPALADAVVSAVAVLIIACPCAMGLATPTAIMVGTGRAAELGILFRRGDALQALGRVDLVAFDKTGTLTKGKPELTDLIVAEGFDRSEVLRIIAAIEQRSEHPVALAIVAAARSAGLEIGTADAVTTEPGLGISGVIEGRRVVVGARRYMAELGVETQALAMAAGALAAEGKSPLFTAVDGQLAALVAVSDPLREMTPVALETLKALGIATVMITGDNAGTARAVAGRLGIGTFHAEVMPEGKLAILRALRAEDRRLAFVGDGINDAPALAEADVGIAIGTGTDVAIESADVVLMSGDLRKVGAAIALSRATMRCIRQNLFWAFAYNAALIPVAAGVLYPAFGFRLSPVLGAGAMAFSSVFVIANALRLRRFVVPGAYLTRSSG
jgi:P-type Cu+ transporter